MNLKLRTLGVSLLSLASITAFADVYTDAIDDIAVGTFPHIDITSVTVTNTDTDLTFSIALNGDPIATNWGKYNIIMRSPGAGAGDTSANGNGWGRPYSLDGGANKFIGGWADASTDNAQLWTFSGGSWAMEAGTTGLFTSSITTSSITYTRSLASLGLSIGDVLVFDVATTGGGGSDTAVESLSKQTAQVTAWDEVTVLQGQSYNVVPEPASMIALGLGAAAMLRRRRK